MAEGTSNDGSDQQRNVPPPLPAFPPPLPDSPPPPFPPPLPGSIPGFAPTEDSDPGSGATWSAASPSAPHVMTGQLVPPAGMSADVLGLFSVLIGVFSLPVVGCCTFMCFPVGILGFLAAVAGVVLGMMGMRKASAEGRKSAVSIAGVALSILSGLIGLGWFLLMLVAIGLEAMS